MPELPEVEILKQHLKEAIVGLTIRSIDVRSPKSFAGDRTSADRSKIVDVTRRHKILFIHVSNRTILAIHLKMTGQLIFVRKDQLRGFFGGHPERAYGQPPPHQYTRVIIEFTNGDHLYFNDLRKFGWMKILSQKSKISASPAGRKSQNEQEEFKKFVDGFAPEPLDKKFTMSDFSRRLKTRSRLTIKQALMDEKRVVAGIGNIYSDETLFCARINPLRKVHTLTEGEIKKVFACVPKTLEKAIEMGGTSFSTYRHLSGEQGRYAKIAKVYGKENEKCSNGCGGVIERHKIGGRSTHFCANCQQ